MEKVKKNAVPAPVKKRPEKKPKPKKGSYEAILKSMEYAAKHPIEFVNGW